MVTSATAAALKIFNFPWFRIKALKIYERSVFISRGGKTKIRLGLFHRYYTRFLFLVACTRLYNPLCLLVGRSVTLYSFMFFSVTSLLLPKWSSDLKYGPCPPARDFGSRVSCLVSCDHATLKEALSVRLSVGPSIRESKSGKTSVFGF